MRIELDPIGAPHWLLDKGRAWLLWFIREQRNRIESARFYVKHGRVIRSEPLHKRRES